MHDWIFVFGNCVQVVESLKIKIWKLLELWKLKFGSYWKLKVENESWKLKMEVIGSWKFKIEVGSWKWKLLEVESWKWKLKVGSRSYWKVKVEILKILKFEFFFESIVHS